MAVWLAKHERKSQLNAQGRARPEIAALYNWRYKDLGNLPMVQNKPQYLTANAGFAYDYQMVDVPDFEVSQTTRAKNNTRSTRS